MGSGVNAQLGISAWPALPLPLPDVLKVESILDLENGVILPRARGPLRMRLEPTAMTPTGETYLRLNEVDLDDPEAIFAFASEYGTLGGDRAYVALTGEDPSFEMLYRVQFDRDPIFEFEYRPQLDREVEWEKKVRAVWRETRRGDPSLAFFDGSIERNPLEMIGADPARVLPYLETLEEFRFAARCLRDLSSAWRMFKDGLDVADVEWASLRADGPFASVHQAAHLLDAMLTRFLRYFSPQLSWRQVGRIGRETRVPALDVEPKREPSKAPLFAICALELFNHIIEGAKYSVCANERCQRTFVHQQGRSEKGQHRSRSVLYCTPGCARATAQREYRRRRLSRERGDQRTPGVSNARTARSEASDWT